MTARLAGQAIAPSRCQIQFDQIKDCTRVVSDSALGGSLLSAKKPVREPFGPTRLRL